MIKVLVCGIGGKMGANITALLNGDNQAQAVCGVDLHAPENCQIPVYSSFGGVKENVDVIIDFSSPKVIREELSWAVKHNVPAVLASTGYSAEDLKFIEGNSGVPFGQYVARHQPDDGGAEKVRFRAGRGFRRRNYRKAP